jgi:hypothetical protein
MLLDYAQQLSYFTPYFKITLGLPCENVSAPSCELASAIPVAKTTLPSFSVELSMRPTRAASRGGWALYELYRTTSRVAAPAVLLWRRLQGLEHPTRWPERLGRPSAARPRPGSPLVWFHAVSLGEGMAALPIVRHCVRLRPGLPVLFTTTTLSSS